MLKTCHDVVFSLVRKREMVVFVLEGGLLS